MRIQSLKKFAIAALFLLLLTPAVAQRPAFTPPVVRFSDHNGKPLVFGKLYSYQAGTTTPLATYVDSTSGTVNQNPVVLDSTGSASIFLGANVYKFVLQDSSGAVQWTADNIAEGMFQSGYVSSVFGRHGDVTAQPGDYTCSQVTGAICTAQTLYYQTVEAAGTGQTQESKLNFITGIIGSVDLPTITGGGSGYTGAPSVAFSGGGCSSEPTGSATVTAGAVASLVLVTGGVGCTSVPTVAFSGGGGSGATGTVSLVANGISCVDNPTANSTDCMFTFGTGSGGGGTAAPIVQTDVTTLRSFNTIYQNTNTTAMYVSGSGAVTGAGGDSQMYCQDGPGIASVNQSVWATTETATVSGEASGFACFVPAGYWYKIGTVGSISGPVKWFEYTGFGGGSSGTGGITAITGDLSAAGTGTVTGTLATVNTAPGACGDATHVCVVTTNAKGLVVAQSAVAITGSLTGVSINGVTPTAAGSSTTYLNGAGSYTTPAGTGGGVSSINSTTGAFTFTGAGVSCATTTCTFSGTGSGVSSVALTAPSWLTVGGSPITTSGTLAITGTSEPANYFLAAPNGSAGAMVPRLIVPADIPTLNQSTTGTAGNVTGIVAPANGGTGATTAAANTVFGNFTGSVAAPGFSASPVFSAANLTSFPTFNQSTTGNAATATSATTTTNLAGGALGSTPYQSAAGTTAFLASPVTTGTYLQGWTPAGSAIAPAAINLTTLFASPTFTGVPIVPTATAGTSTTQAASTAFVGTATTGMVTVGGTQTLTNKTLTSPTITGATLTTSSINGVTPTAVGTATTYLNGAGAYTTPAGSGSVTAVSIGTQANGITASVATGTTTPVISVGGSALTPATVAATTSVSAPAVSATGSGNGSLNLTYTGTAATAPAANTVQIAPAVPITTAYSISPAGAPVTGVVVGTATGVTEQLSFVPTATLLAGYPTLAASNTFTGAQNTFNGSVVINGSGTFGNIFNSATGNDFTGAGPTYLSPVSIATSSANYAPPLFEMYASYWNGTAGALDPAIWTYTPGTGTNPSMTYTLNLGASGSTGTHTIAFGNPFTAPSIGNVLYADQFTGADIGAKINAAFASQAGSSGQGTLVKLSPNLTYTFSTQIVMPGSTTSPVLDCQGAVLSWAGTTDAINVPSESAPGFSGAIKNCVIATSSTTAGIAGVHQFSRIEFTYENDYFVNWSGSGQFGILLDNTGSGFNERTQILNDHWANDTFGVFFRGSNGGTNSFARTIIRNGWCGVGTGQICMYVNGNNTAQSALMYDSYIDLRGNGTSGAGIGIYLNNGAWIASSVLNMGFEQMAALIDINGSNTVLQGDSGVIDAFGGTNIIYTNGGLASNVSIFNLESAVYSNAGVAIAPLAMTFTAVDGTVACQTTCTASNGEVKYTATSSAPVSTEIVAFVPASGLALNCTIAPANNTAAAMQPWYFAGGAGADGIALNVATVTSTSYYFTYNCF